MTEETFEVEIEIVEQGATADDVDKSTRQLIKELRDLPVESVSMVNNGFAPSGTKSVDPVTIGALAIAVLPSFLPKVVDSVQSWALRKNGRIVKFKGKINGQTIEFEGHPDELEKILEKFSKGRKKKS